MKLRLLYQHDYIHPQSTTGTGFRYQERVRKHIPSQFLNAGVQSVITIPPCKHRYQSWINNAIIWVEAANIDSTDKLDRWRFIGVTLSTVHLQFVGVVLIWGLNRYILAILLR